MKVNWRARLQNWSFWATVVPALFLIAQVICDALGVTANWEEIQRVFWDIAKVLWSVLATIGIVNDPTTSGTSIATALSDSPQALLYEKPKISAAVAETETGKVIYNKNTILESISRICRAENGYLNHETADDLDNATANPAKKGGGKFTKYARDLDAISYFYGKKQNKDGCCVFICWVVYMACGCNVALTKKLLGQPDNKNYAASTEWLCKYLNKVEPHTTADCQVGDVVLYDYSDDGKDSYDHVGIIYKVDKDWIYVAQGNAMSIGENGGVGIDFIHSATHKAVQGIFRPHWDRL